MSTLLKLNNVQCTKTIFFCFNNLIILIFYFIEIFIKLSCINHTLSKKKTNFLIKKIWLKWLQKKNLFFKTKRTLLSDDVSWSKWKFYFCKSKSWHLVLHIYYLYRIKKLYNAIKNNFWPKCIQHFLGDNIRKKLNFVDNFFLLFSNRTWSTMTT